MMRRMLALCESEDILQPQAIYGYWKAAGQGNDLIVFDQDGSTELARFTLPRQPREDGECIADFFRDVDDAERDVIGLQVVTVGQKASDTARVWFEENRYQDYLYLHGLSVEMAEAMAEYAHKRIRAELGFAGEDDRDMEKMLAQGYRGSRYSFGYPACPKLEDQAPLLQPAGGGADRRFAVRRMAAASGAVDQRDRRAESAGEVFFGVGESGRDVGCGWRCAMFFAVWAA